MLLLDEPFAALDSAVRERLQLDLAALQAEQRLVVIYVTHRLEDAFAIGHRLAILADGQVQQIGRIDEVFRQPANSHVAQVMGLRNLFEARVLAVSPEHLLLDWDGLLVEAPAQAADVGAAVAAYIRPEDVKFLYPDRPLMGAVQHNLAAGVVLGQQASASFQRWRVLLSNGCEIEVRSAGSRLCVAAPARWPARAGVVAQGRGRRAASSPERCPLTSLRRYTRWEDWAAGPQ